MCGCVGVGVIVRVGVRVSVCEEGTVWVGQP